MASLIGPAGEHYVMSQLLRRGVIAALTPIGAPNADILVSDVAGNQQCAVQVKSRVGVTRDQGWHMSAKHELLTSPKLFYAFVDFGANSEAVPNTYIVPSEDVAKVLRLAHNHWTSTPGKNGTVRRDNRLRRLLPNYDVANLKIGYSAGWLDVYLERWDHIVPIAFEGDVISHMSGFSAAAEPGIVQSRSHEINSNGQRLVEQTNVPGNHPYAKMWKLQCTQCNSTYLANSCDFHLRRCPSCQGGAASTETSRRQRPK